MKRRLILSGLCLLSIVSTTFAQGDTDVVKQIINEGKTNNQVWEHLTDLSTNIGPRLTGSTAGAQANLWAANKLRSFGLKNVHLHKWGEIPVRFDRGPSHAKMIAPVERDFEFTTNSWSAGTDGTVRGIVLPEPKTLEELNALKDKLPGAWILKESRGRRLGPSGRRRRGGGESESEQTGEKPLSLIIAERLSAGGVAGSIVSSGSEIVQTSAIRNWRSLDFNDLPTDVSITVRESDFDAIKANLDSGETVEVEVNANNQFLEGPIPVYNTIGEIPGTEFPDEVVVISAHIDSWDGPGSSGTQDNGTGSCVTIEAARILAAVGAKPRRTIRFCLWTGEEQGLLGSRAYVESLSDEERAKISVCFVDDGGTNYQGAITCLESQREIFEEATAAVTQSFPDMPVKIIAVDKIPRGGASDHASFIEVGIPGFFWREDGMGGREGKNYRFVWHTQNDTLRYAVPGYLVQSSTNSAVTAYNLAMADSLVPREKTEEPQK
ncbi:MAG: M20/M25/M40 family metallo-hydrolase [Pirellulaceae bacterium]|nr:M20/M25/M40 family metallo-hydrolase [Pirellulaceae bacterium]